MNEKPISNTVFSPGWSGFTADWFTHRIPAWRKHLLPKLAMQETHWLEIGAFEGRSATWVMDNVLHNPASTITVIDPWPKPEVFQRFESNIRAAHKELQGRGMPKGKPQVIVLPGFSYDVLPTLRPAKKRFDVVYVDGDHQAKSALADGIMAWLLLKKGGHMIFDDYKWEYPAGSEDRKKKLPAHFGIDAFLKFWASELTVVHKDYQVIIQKLV